MLWLGLHMFVQRQMLNTMPYAPNTIAMLLNVSKRQHHFLIMMAVIATNIVTRQHARKTTAPLQLNRLQQSAISW